MRELPVMAAVAVATGIAAWWLLRPDASVGAPAASAVTATPAPAKSPMTPAANASVAAQSSPAAPVAPAPKATSAVHFTDVGATHDDLDLQVNGGIGLWNAAEHRLRVLLTDEPLNPAEERQMLGFLRDERLADSGRPYGLLELQFSADAPTPDRSALKSATLTVATAGGLVHDTANVLPSIQWKGDVQPSSTRDGNARGQLYLSTAGTIRSADVTPSQQNWQLSVAVPVVQAAAP